MKNLFLGLLLIFVCASAQAATVTFYTDRASFESAVSSSTTIDFEDIAPVNGYVAYSTSFFDVIFSGTVLRVVDDSPVGWSGAPFQSDLLACAYNSVIAADLTSAGTGFSAVGGWFGVNTAGYGYEDVPVTLILTLAGGETFTESVSAGNMHVGKPEVFYGWTVEGGEITGVSHDTTIGWEALDNFTYGYATTLTTTVSGQLVCTPSSGTLPFATQMTATLTNNYTGQFRQMAAKIHLTLGNGGYIAGWRAGYTNVSPGDSYATVWNQSLPTLGSLVGDNVFQLVTEDVTPAPYNQAPYPPSGDTGTASCTVTGSAP